MTVESDLRVFWDFDPVITETKKPYYVVWGPYSDASDVGDLSKLVKRQVWGYPVLIDGWEKYDFFVWKTDGELPQWSVTEVRTGMSFSLGKTWQNTRKDAIAVATVRLERAGREKVRRLVDEWALIFKSLPEMS